jgi:hypothetical protein
MGQYNGTASPHRTDAYRLHIETLIVEIVKSERFEDGSRAIPTYLKSDELRRLHQQDEVLVTKDCTACTTM